MRLRFLGWMTGWQAVPECWRQLLWPPLRIDLAPGWISVQVLGIALFLAREPEEGDV